MDVVATEEAWRRYTGNDGKEKIEYKASIYEPAEYQHDPCDWIWKETSSVVNVGGNVCHLSWTIFQTNTGSMMGVAFTLTHGNLYGSPGSYYPFTTNLINLQVPDDSFMSKFLIPYCDFIPNWMRSKLAVTKTIPIYKPLFEIVYKNVIRNL